MSSGGGDARSYTLIPRARTPAITRDGRSYTRLWVKLVDVFPEEGGQLSECAVDASSQAPHSCNRTKRHDRHNQDILGQALAGVVSAQSAECLENVFHSVLFSSPSFQRLDCVSQAQIVTLNEKQSGYRGPISDFEVALADSAGTYRRASGFGSGGIVNCRICFAL